MKTNKPSEADLKFYAGHRERLRKKFMDGNITEPEFVELQLMYVIPRRDVRPIARALMYKYGGLLNITTAPIKELLKVPGIGQRAAEYLKSLHYATTLQYRQELQQTTIFNSPNALENYCKMIVAQKPKEEVHVLYMDDMYKLLTEELHTIGTINESKVYTNDIVARACELNASCVILVHNHPSGTHNFSYDDAEITKELYAKLLQFNVQLLDHYLVVDGDLISAKDSLILDPVIKISQQHCKDTSKAPAE